MAVPVEELTKDGKEITTRCSCYLTGVGQATTCNLASMFCLIFT
jgi:hypothetical protein